MSPAVKNIFSAVLVGLPLMACGMCQKYGVGQVVNSRRSVELQMPLGSICTGPCRGRDRQ